MAAMFACQYSAMASDLELGTFTAEATVSESPLLSTLDIGHVIGLPLALLKNTHVRKLGIQYVSIHDYHTPVMGLDFTGLEALDICIEAPHPRTKNRPLDLYTGTTNSRQLSIGAYPESRGLVLEIVQNVMERASRTLKHVRWQGYQKWNRDLCAITFCWYPAPRTQLFSQYTLAPDFTLATLSNLQSLSISIYHIIKDDIISAIELLQDPAVSRNLEELTLIFHWTSVLEGWQVLAEVIASSACWEMLDAALGTLRVGGVDSPLCAVSVYIESLWPDPDAGGRQLQRKLEARLPLLMAKGAWVSVRPC